MNAAKAIKLVKEQLKLLGLDLNKDVVATVTDGANLSLKFGKDTCLKHVTCYAHAIHLAVCNVPYKKPQHKPSKDFICLVDDYESDPENDSITENENYFEEEKWNIVVFLESTVTYKM